MIAGLQSNASTMSSKTQIGKSISDIVLYTKTQAKTCKQNVYNPSAHFARIK